MLQIVSFLISVWLAYTRAATIQANFTVQGMPVSVTASTLVANFTPVAGLQPVSASVAPLSGFGVSVQVCPLGAYSSANSQTCTLCPAGKYSVTPAAGSVAACVACPQGTYSGAAGANSLSACVLCPANTYFQGQGATSVLNCTACPANTFSNQPYLKTDCICNAGYNGSNGMPDQISGRA
jgi:hypothetical protein